MRFFPVISALTLLLGSASHAAAQELTRPSPASTVTAGTRVRVLSTTVLGRVRGVVTATDETDLTLIPEGGGPLKLPLGSITGMDVSLGRKRNWLKGLGIGVAAGAALGFAMPVDPDFCGAWSDSFCSRGEAVAASAGAYGLIGAGIGALIKTDRWVPISLGVGRPPKGASKGRAVQATATLQF
jgi:hypothetical protein